MEIKPESNPIQDLLIKKPSNNININEEIKENNISEIPSIIKNFSNANSIIMPNVIII